MRRAPGFLLAGMVAVCADDARAVSFDLPPRAVPTAETRSPATGLPFPVTPFADFDPGSDRLRGDVSRRAYRIPNSAITPLQIVDFLRPQFSAAGYDILYECQDQACGGFDFRFALDMIGEPDMHVDLGNFRYLAARQSGDGAGLAVLASRSASAAFVHITTVTPHDGADDGDFAAPALADQPPDAEKPGALLDARGRVVLRDVDFATGSATLGEGPFPALSDLARHLSSRPERRITLVGHTDAEGPLDRNLALSRARAEAVRTRLIEAHGVAPEQIAGAEGVGYLMPLAPNTTDENRRLNRRVEAVLIDLE